MKKIKQFCLWNEDDEALLLAKLTFPIAKDSQG